MCMQLSNMKGVQCVDHDGMVGVAQKKIFCPCAVDGTIHGRETINPSIWRLDDSRSQKLCCFNSTILCCKEYFCPEIFFSRQKKCEITVHLFSVKNIICYRLQQGPRSWGFEDLVIPGDHFLILSESSPFYVDRQQSSMSSKISFIFPYQVDILTLNDTEQ